MCVCVCVWSCRYYDNTLHPLDDVPTKEEVSATVMQCGSDACMR